jgi:hypothetical protein
MANTTYFGWETPDDTDLVKDGAAAIRTLGQAIDTSMQDLEGGTTGQILSKNSNADMDFVWVTNDVGDITEVVAGTGLSGGGSSGSVTLTNTVATEFDAKGDLVVGTGADTFDKLSAGTNDHRLVAASGETTGLKYVADTQNTVIDAEGDLLVGDAADAVQRLAIGSNGNVLTVDTAVDGKIKWAAPAGGASTLVLVKAPTSFSNVANTGTTFDNVFTSPYETYLIVIENIGGGTAADDLLFNLRYAGPTTQTDFAFSNLRNDFNATTYSTSVSSSANLIIHPHIGTTTFPTRAFLTVQGGYTTGYPMIYGFAGSQDNSSMSITNGIAGNSRSYTGFLLKSASSNVTGTVAVYAYARS